MTLRHYLPLYLLSVSSSSLFRTSVIRSLPFICDMKLMAWCCTISMSPANEGSRTDAAYFICSLQRLVYAKSRACLGALLCRACLIMLSCLLALDTLLCNVYWISSQTVLLPLGILFLLQLWGEHHSVSNQLLKKMDFDRAFINVEGHAPYSGQVL